MANGWINLSIDRPVVVFVSHGVFRGVVPFMVCFLWELDVEECVL